MTELMQQVAEAMSLKAGRCPKCSEKIYEFRWFLACSDRGCDWRRAKGPRS